MGNSRRVPSPAIRTASSIEGALMLVRTLSAPWVFFTMTVIMTFSFLFGFPQWTAQSSTRREGPAAFALSTTSGLSAGQLTPCRCC